MKCSKCGRRTKKVKLIKKFRYVEENLCKSCWKTVEGTDLNPYTNKSG